MRLLNIDTLKLEWFHSAEVAPSYAILSHRWENEEVLFEDVEEKPEARKLRSIQAKLEETEKRLDFLCRKLENPPTQEDSSTVNASRFARLGLKDQMSSMLNRPEELSHIKESQQQKPKGWAKVLGCCKIAKQVGLSYVWIDTCCIDKGSSSELSDSINSMFAWYRRAALCIAYLSDVACGWSKIYFREPGTPQDSAWFSRGWTLQELIAPKDIWFYAKDWKFSGIRSQLVDELYEITRIKKEILEWNGAEKLHSVSVAARMSWAASRNTTRSEDKAYSLLGIFGINMPIMYGEGEQNAFFRLQTAIFQKVPDHSIFAWEAKGLPEEEHLRFFGYSADEVGLVAPSPACFTNQARMEFMKPEHPSLQLQFPPHSSHATSVHLSLRLITREDEEFDVYRAQDRYEAILGSSNSSEDVKQIVTVILICTSHRYITCLQERIINTCSSCII